MVAEYVFYLTSPSTRKQKLLLTLLIGVEDDRKLSPSYSGEKWDAVLKRTGFTGADLEVHDCEDEANYSMSTFLATATNETPPDYPQEVVLVYGDCCPPQAWLDDLRKSIAAVTFCEPEVKPLNNEGGEGSVCIFLGEMDQPLLNRMDSAQFGAIQTLLTRSKGVLWVSRGGAINCERPEFGLVTGLLRTLRCEDTNKRLVSLDLDPARSPWTSIDTQAILDVFKQTFDYAQDQNGLDFEYAERNHLIQVPRTYEHEAESNAVAAQPVERVPEMQPFSQPGRELCLEVGTRGMLDTLVFKEDVTFSSSEMQEDFVEIETKAFGLNFRDLMVALGQLESTILGYECSGIITKVGADTSHGLKVGDRVCALIRGNYANHIRLHWTSVACIPDSMSFEHAASVPMVFITAYAGLYDTARLQKGESILIHAATGGVGQAAVMLAHLAGAEVFVTVGSEQKRDFVNKTFGIPPDHIFSSRDTSFAKSLMAMTKDKGVDVVLNSLAGQLLQESWNCMAQFGRFVEIGKRNLELNSGLGMAPFARSASFTHIDMVHLGTHKGQDVARILKHVLQLLGDKTIHVVSPITVYPLSEMEKALRLMQAGNHLGKLIIKPNPDDLVRVCR